MTRPQMTVTIAAMRNVTQTVVEAEHLVLHRRLLVLLATFGLNRIPNLLSRNFLDKRSGPKMHGCFNLNFWFQVQLEYLAGRTFPVVTSLCFHGSLIF